MESSNMWAQTMEMAKRHDTGRQAAGWIGDAIYGVNDGLGAIFGIVSGVSGATLGNSHYVLLAGIAGMIASALSMGSGAYLGAKSEREDLAGSRLVDPEILRVLDHGLLDGQPSRVDAGDESVQVRIAGPLVCFGTCGAQIHSTAVVPAAPRF